MSKALEGEHLCAKHQGNHSHYADHNCTICKKEKEIAKLREQLAAKDEDIKKWAALNADTIYVAELAQKRAEAAEAKIKALDEQEPVAYLVTWNDRVRGSGRLLKFDATSNTANRVSALYTKPVPPADAQELRRMWDESEADWRRIATTKDEEILAAYRQITKLEISLKALEAENKK